MIDTSFPRLFADPDCFRHLVNQLQNGGIVALPTDTLYGLAVDGASRTGVEAIYRLKGRDENKPLILFLADLEALDLLPLTISAESRLLLHQHWPGALTAVFPFAKDPRLTAFSFPGLGIRIPDHDDLRKFLREYPGFLLTTSCNRSDTPPLATVGEIRREFGRELAGIIDGGELRGGVRDRRARCFGFETA